MFKTLEQAYLCEANLNGSPVNGIESKELSDLDVYREA